MENVFSVVVPLFNKEKFIMDCVKSVLSQNFSDYEVIVVDDGSTDSGLATLKEINSPKLKIIEQENQGVAQARNAGINAAQFAWVAFLDADDLWAPHHLNVLATAISRLPSANGIATVSVPVPVRFKLDEKTAMSACTEQIVVKEVDYFKAAASDASCFHTSAAAVRTSKLQEIGGFKPFRFGQDQECWVRVFLNSPCVLVNVETAFYRQDTGGAMDSMRTQPKADVPTRLADVSPAVRTLCSVDVGSSRSKCINLYIDSRVAKTVLRLLEDGRLRDAQKVVTLIGHSEVNRFYLLKALLFVPASFSPIVARLVSIKRKFRRA